METWCPITLGSRVNVQDGCIIHTDADKPMDIEEGVVLGHAAVLHGCRVGGETLIGIERRAAERQRSGRGMFDRRRRRRHGESSNPARSVVMGIPGRVVREIRAEELERTRSINAYYLELQRYVRGGFPPPWTR